MRLLPAVAVALLVLLAAGCAGPAAAPRVDRFVAVVSNQADAEPGDLLDESLTVLCLLEPSSGPHESFQLAPGESRTFDLRVGDLEEFAFRCTASTVSRTSSSAYAEFTQERCGHLEAIHLDVRFFAKLTAGAWKWGATWDGTCSLSVP
jgi:hypothetical protein